MAGGLTWAVTLELTKAVGRGCNCCALGALAAERTVVERDPERTKVRDLTKERRVPKSRPVWVFAGEQNAPAVTECYHFG